MYWGLYLCQWGDIMTIKCSGEVHCHFDISSMHSLKLGTMTVNYISGVSRKTIHTSCLADQNVLLRVEKQQATEFEHKLLLHGMYCDLSLPLYKLFHWYLSFVSPSADRQNYLETPFRCRALRNLRPWSRDDLHKDQMLRNTADFKCHLPLFPTSNWL